MATKEEKAQALADIRAIVDGSDGTVFTILRHVSASGMLRVIDLVVFTNGQPRWIGMRYATAAGRKYDERREGIRVNGAGMDMGYALVYDLSGALYPGASGGYRLNHRWL